MTAGTSPFYVYICIYTCETSGIARCRCVGRDPVGRLNTTSYGSSVGELGAVPLCRRDTGGQLISTIWEHMAQTFQVIWPAHIVWICHMTTASGPTLNLLLYSVGFLRPQPLWPSRSVLFGEPLAARSPGWPAQMWWIDPQDLQVWRLGPAVFCGRLLGQGARTGMRC